MRDEGRESPPSGETQRRFSLRLGHGGDFCFLLLSSFALEHAMTTHATSHAADAHLRTNPRRPVSSSSRASWGCGFFGHGNPALLRAVLRLCRLSGQPSGSFRIRSSVSLEAVGALNTMVLIFSSFTMAAAVRLAIRPPAMAGRAAGRDLGLRVLLPGRQVHRIQGQVGGRAVGRGEVSARGAAAGRRHSPAATRRQARPCGSRRSGPDRGPLDHRAGGDRQAGNLARVARQGARAPWPGSDPSLTTSRCSSAFIS